MNGYVFFTDEVTFHTCKKVSKHDGWIWGSKRLYFVSNERGRYISWASARAWWPPRCPVLTPCDFIGQGYVKDQIYWRKNVIVQEVKIRKADAFIQIAGEMHKRNLWSELENRLDIFVPTTVLMLDLSMKSNIKWRSKCRFFNCYNNYYAVLILVESCILFIFGTPFIT